MELENTFALVHSESQNTNLFKKCCGPEVDHEPVAHISLVSKRTYACLEGPESGARKFGEIKI